jgi:GDPmannose 4,6-dehydratase
VGIALRWEGTGVEEKGYDAKTGALLVEVDPRYFRPTEVETLLGDSTKAKEKLGWVPEISLDDMVAEMVRGDLKIAERDELCRREGFDTFDYNE